MLYQRVKVIRDVNTVYNRAVPEWEIPVLTFIFDEGNVTPQVSFEIVDRPYPEGGSEYDRLVRRYGSDTKSGMHGTLSSPQRMPIDSAVPRIFSEFFRCRAGTRAGP